jgi:H+/Cl- antiporter ClcA
MTTPPLDKNDLEVGSWATFRARFLSKGALATQGLLVLAALLTGVIALYFRQADIAGSDFFLDLYASKTVFGVALPGGTGIWLAAATVVVGMVLIIWLRDRFFPGTEGTGIPQAIACLKVRDSSFRGYMLSVKITIGKILLLTIGLFTGMTIASPITSYSGA